MDKHQHLLCKCGQIQPGPGGVRARPRAGHSAPRGAGGPSYGNRARSRQLATRSPRAGGPRGGGGGPCGAGAERHNALRPGSRPEGHSRAPRVRFLHPGFSFHPPLRSIFLRGAPCFHAGAQTPHPAPRPRARPPLSPGRASSVSRHSSRAPPRPGPGVRQVPSRPEEAGLACGVARGSCRITRISGLGAFEASSHPHVAGGRGASPLVRP